MTFTSVPEAVTFLKPALHQFTRLLPLARRFLFQADPPGIELTLLPFPLTTLQFFSRPEHHRTWHNQPRSLRVSLNSATFLANCAA
jgi:hypothetical protein